MPTWPSRFEALRSISHARRGKARRAERLLRRELLASACSKAGTWSSPGRSPRTTATRVIEKLLALSADLGRPHHAFYLNSPGRSRGSGDTIPRHDRLRHPQVRTWGTGWVASARGADLRGAVPRERRFSAFPTPASSSTSVGSAGRHGQRYPDRGQPRSSGMRDRLNRIFAKQYGASRWKPDRGGHAPELLAQRLRSCGVRAGGVDHRAGLPTGLPAVPRTPSSHRGDARGLRRLEGYARGGSP